MDQLAHNHSQRRRRRAVIPRFPAFNVYSRAVRIMTALGPISVATSVNEVEGWDVEVIEEINYRWSGPKDEAGVPDDTLNKPKEAGYADPRDHCEGEDSQVCPDCSDPWIFPYPPGNIFWGLL